MLGLDERDVVRPVLWVDTGSEQLVVPAGVQGRGGHDASPSRTFWRGMAPMPCARGSPTTWAQDADGQVAARFFFLKHGAVMEDPGTGSACANLGGWHLATKAPLSLY